jgi:hypothetical protein
MRVPFLPAFRVFRALRAFPVWKRHGARGAAPGGQPVAEPLADQPVAPPLPRRRPGSHGVKAVKVERPAADTATLQKILDRLNRL